MPSSVSTWLRAQAGTVDRALADALGDAALDTKRALDPIAQAVAGADMRLSGASKRGAKIGTRYDRTKGSRGLELTVHATGPWQWSEYGRRGGYPIPKRRGRGKNARRKVPRLHYAAGDGGWSSGKAEGGPVGGRRRWSTAAAQLLDSFPDTFERKLLDALAKG